MKKKYNYCLKYIFKLKRLGIKLELSTIKHVLKKLGNPEKSFFSIHIAGSNGKGSIASGISKILQNAGYRVGLYTSPHLIRFNERIRINDRQIDNEFILKAWEKIKSVATNRKMTFFEFATAMALYVFEKKKINFAVIETGMGGKLDATNVLKPIISIITNISLEHKNFLGKTLRRISKEKGGIIKYKTPVVIGSKQPESIKILKKISHAKLSNFYLKEKDFKIKKNKKNKIEYFGIYSKLENIIIGLLGDHQISNSSLILASCEIMNLKYTKISNKNISYGLLKNKWQGRLEVVLESPLTIVDGAHNLAAAKELGSFIRKKLGNVTIIIGILDDKPYFKILQELVPLCSKIIITQPKIERSLPVNKILSATRKLTNIANIKIIKDVGNALTYAIEHSQKKHPICVAGSLYTVGEAKKSLKKMNLSSRFIKGNKY